MTIKTERNLRYFSCALFSVFVISILSVGLIALKDVTQSGFWGYVAFTVTAAVLTVIFAPTPEKCAFRLFLLVSIPYAGIVINVLLMLKQKRRNASDPPKVRLWADKRQFIKEGKEEVTYFSEGKEYFSDLISELQSAKEEVLIFSYIFTFGKASTLLFNELFPLLYKGVKVTIGVDYFGSGNILKSETVKTLKKAGLGVIIKNKPFLFLGIGDNRRTHAKTVIIDKKTVYLSSANIDDKSIFKDVNCSVKIKGNVSEIYNEYRSLFNAPLIAEKKTETCFPLLSEGDIKKDDLYVDFILKAESEIKIVTPYLSFDAELKKAIIRKLSRGVKITLIIPSPVFPSKADPVTEYYARTLQSLGVNVFYEDGEFLHSKMIIIDGYFAVIGSNNFDLRSGYATETMLLTVDNGLIAPLLNNFDSLMRKAKILQPKKRQGKFMGKVYSVIAPLI